MKNKFISLSVFLCILAGYATGQDEKRTFLYIGTGIDFIGCEPPEKDYIRGDIDPNPYDNVTFGPDYVTDEIRSLLHADFLCVKFEYRVLNRKLGIAGGLRYTRVVSSIGRPSYFSDSPEYFYLQYAQDGTNTEYAKVREIIQRSGYAGIPLEFRIYPYEPRRVNLYFMAGGSFNFNVLNRTEIVFYKEEMEPYEEEVSESIEDPYPFYASLHLGAGLQIGRPGKPGFNLEICVPAGMITTGETGFVDPDTGIGFRLMFRLPL